MQHVHSRDAKLSVIDWDDSNHCIHTSSLHFFEGDPSIRLGRTVFPNGPAVRADPQVRLFQMALAPVNFAVLPLVCSCLHLPVFWFIPPDPGLRPSILDLWELTEGTQANLALPPVTPKLHCHAALIATAPSIAALHVAAPGV